MHARPHLLKTGLLLALACAAWPALAERGVSPPAEPERKAPLFGDPREDPATPSPEEALTKAEFMARAGGKVVVYLDAEGLPYGEEYFDPDKDEATWRYLDGGCQTAAWAARGSLFCFAYDQPSCWRVRAGEDPTGEWTAHLISPREQAPQWVRMARFEARRLHCDSAPIASRAP